jgi:hypothetical protein
MVQICQSSGEVGEMREDLANELKTTCEILGGVTVEPHPQI